MSNIKKHLDKIILLFNQAGIKENFLVIYDVTCLLYLKSLEDFQVVGNYNFSYSDSIFEDHEDCRWSIFVCLNYQDMYVTYQNKILPFLYQLPNSMGLEMFSRSDRKRLTPESFFLVVSAINQMFMLELDGDSITKENIVIYDDIYETLLTCLFGHSYRAELAIPRHLRRLMCELLQIKCWDKVYDTSLGDGSLLIDAYHYMAVADAPQYHIGFDEDGFKCILPYNDTVTTNVLRSGLTLEGDGSDYVLTWLCLMNFYFHRINLNQPQFKEFVVTCKTKEPFYDKILSAFPTRQSFEKFNENIDKLGMGGVCVALVPTTLLYRTTKKTRKLRKRLLTQFTIDAVIALPIEEFLPASGISTAIVVFKYGASSNADKIWFCELYNDGYSNDRRRVKNSDKPLPLLVSSYLHHIEVSNQWFKSQNIPLVDVMDNEGSLLVAQYVDNADDRDLELDPQKLVRELGELQDKVKQGIDDLTMYL